MKKTDVLWLVEHIVREMDVACAVKRLIQDRYGINIEIRNIYFHANDVMKEFIPSIVVFPFLYRISDLAIEDYVGIWPEATYFNLAWEQVHYNAHLKMKAPGDGFTRQRVIHHAWGDFYRDYLMESGVPPEHIFVNGNPVYQLYKHPYNRYFKQKEQLAQQYGLGLSKRWVFIPENYKWAFYSDEKLRRSAERGGNLEEHWNMRAFCQESLRHLLQWCNSAGRNEELEIIFRPRPATNSRQMEDFFRKFVGVSAKHLHIIKNETVRDWILASDIVFSSYSTSLIEAAVAGKPIYMVEPIPIPDSLSSDWYRFVPRIHSNDEFEAACMNLEKDFSCDLRVWAEKEMLSKGDPISELADFVGKIVENRRTMNASLMGRLPISFPRPFLTSLLVSRKQHFRRLVSYSSKAIRAIYSAGELFLLILRNVTKAVLRRNKDLLGQVNLKTVLDKLHKAAYLFSQGFRARNYFNPDTHESDIFMESDVNERAERWRNVLTHE